MRHVLFSLAAACFLFFIELFSLIHSKLCFISEERLSAGQGSVLNHIHIVKLIRKNMFLKKLLVF